MRLTTIFNMLRRSIVALITLVMIVLFASHVMAESEDEEVSFVLILDSSGTMDNSDAQKLHISAAKMFVDMLPSEKARLSVIAFGPNYGNEAYKMDVPKNDGIADSSERDNQDVRVKVYYPLESIANQEEKQKAKDCIDETTDISRYPEKDTLSPIGYAIRAAYEVLEAGGTDDGQAAIILLSDGRVQGQSDYSSGKNVWDSIDEYSDKCGEKQWPIYTLELDEDDWNDHPNGNEQYRANIARTEMRSNIPQRSGGTHIELSEATQAQLAFANVFASFFDIEPVTDQKTITNGEASLYFDVDEMVAETTITLTGDEISKVTDLELVSPEGIIERYESKSGNVTTDAREIVFENRYIVLKLMVPVDGQWAINIHGADGIVIGMFAVSIREMNLQLEGESQQLNEGILPKGGEVTFSLQYMYHDTPYEAEKVYQRIPAKLTIYHKNDGTTNEFEMEADSGKYIKTLKFDGTGSYEINAYVADSHFKNQEKKSNSLQYEVDDLPVVAVNTIPETTVYVNEKTTIDCGAYFEAYDDDPILFGCIMVDDDTSICQISEDGRMTFEAGKKSGVREVIVTATDGTQEQPAEQTLKISIDNHPLQFTSDAMELVHFNSEDADVDMAIEKIRLALPGKQAPGFLMKAADVTKETSWTVIYSDYFEDEDDPLFQDIEVSWELSEGDADTFNIEEKAGEIRLTPLKAGSVHYLITATDPNDSSIQKHVEIEIQAMNAWRAIWMKFRWPVIAAAVICVLFLIFLIICFAGRRIYGIWDVISGRSIEEDRNLGATRSGRKAKCRLDNLLEDLGMDAGFGNVEIRAGNNFNKKVYFCNFKSLDEVVYNGTVIEPGGRIKKISVSREQSITFVKDGTSVTFERH